MVYDQLFGWDDKMNVQPQMVDNWKTSDDGLLYTFTLRRGLKFHDGSDVTTRDVIASLKRMFVRDSQNQILANLIAEYQRVDDQTFSLRLKQPFAFTEFLLGGSNGVVGAIMREKDALTDPFTPVRERIGSGHSASSRPNIARVPNWSTRNSPATCPVPNRRVVSQAARWSRSTGWNG